MKSKEKFSNFNFSQIPGELEKDITDHLVLLANKIAHRKGKKIRIMEVCGTHTVEFARSGITQLLSDSLDLRSGPGCPVCVTDQQDLDRIIALAAIKNTVIVTFGDLVRVPGSSTSLEKEKARGAHIHICYNPMEALNICEKYPGKEIILLGVGFETTIPLLAYTVLQAEQRKLRNFSIITAIKIINPALHALFEKQDHHLDGLILPGHVAAILGRQNFDYLAADYHLPATITGFQPLDLLTGLYSLLEDINNNNPKVTNLYKHVVKEEGNIKAKQIMYRVFQEEQAARWRGLGVIPGSSLELKPEFRHLDAGSRFKIKVRPSNDLSPCRCGEIITGKISPFECPLFNQSCTPANPIGPCMVSAEGACSTYHKFLA